MTRSTIPGIALAALFVAAVGLTAQQPTEDRHSLMDGAWALQFAMLQDLALGPLSGSAISAKHHRSDERALRFGLTVMGEHASGRGDGPDRTGLSVGISTHFLRYPTLDSDPASPVHMFWGVGPLARLDYNHVRTAGGQDLNVRGLALGAGGTIGGEWFVRPRISLSGEYQTALVATFLSEPHPNEWVLRLTSDGVRLGVSMYFR